MELKDLVGEHLLSGVDFGTREPDKERGDWESANTMTFVLDGRAYQVIENPDDGYRSSMRDIQEVTGIEIKNVFEPVRVVGRYREHGKYGGADDVLELIDAANGEVILEAGTDQCDDYYPSFVANFAPEKMAVNASVKQS